MNPLQRLAAFATTLAAVFGLAALAGGAVGPEPRNAAPEPAHGSAMHQVHAESSGGPGGLAIAQDGYRLAVADPSFRSGSTEALRFRVLDRAGKPVQQFDEEHGSKLHLIIARRDLTGYQHLHPRLGADGTWSIPLDLPEPGAYRMFADFHAGGNDLTLGADLFVPGGFAPRPLPAAATRASVDGYEVELSE